jgi:23S rRNA pseudouridine2605 synthase
MILDGRVTVNGVTAALGQRADMRRDAIAVDGAPLPDAGGRVYIMLNKPRGYVTSMSDDRGRRTVVQLTRGAGTRVYPVGRLDMDSEGLLLMTNDGDFALRVAHPSSMKEKVYHIEVTGDARAAPDMLARPMEINGRLITAARVETLRADAGGGLLAVTIREGRNRQLRRMCGLCGLAVVSLRRVAIGGVELGALSAGEWRHLTAGELRRLNSLDAV